MKTYLFQYLQDIPLALKLIIYSSLISCFYYLFDLVRHWRKYNFKNYLDWYDNLLDTIYPYTAVIDFEICMIRLNHNLRMESDQGFHALKHYIFKNHDKLTGLRFFKKVPHTKSNDTNEETWKYDQKKETDVNIIKDSFIKELYLTHNRIILPNGLVVKSDLNIHKTQNDADRNIIDSEKFYFSLQLKCNLFRNSQDNLNFLINEYQKIVNDYLIYTQNKLEDKQFCYFYDSHQIETPYFNKLNMGKEYKSFDSIFFPGKEKFLSEIDFFINNKEFFYKKGKSYRKLICAFGEPGTGKTSLILALLNLLNDKYNQKRQLIHLNFNKLNKKDLQNILFSEYIYVNDHEDGKQHIPFQNRLYYIEEIDGFDSFKSRSNKSKQDEKPDVDYEKICRNILSNKNEKDQNVEFPSSQKDRKLGVHDLLELLDGPISLKNSEIFMMTTNYIDKIDKALLRPGRVNHLIELKKTRVQELKEILEFYYESKIDDKILSDFKDYQFTPAFISETCNFNPYNLNGCLEYLKSKIASY